jgi:hypothetical protein
MRLCLAPVLLFAAVTALPAQTSFHPKTNSPVMIASERKQVQTLADGTHITRITHSWFYRDSQGRTLTGNESTLPSGTANLAITNYVMMDREAGETVFWSVGNPSANQEYTVSQMQPRAPRPFVPALVKAPPPASDTPKPAYKREDLGTQYVQDFPCHATRTTTTYPIDYLGNDRPITTVSENCVSSEFGQPLKSSVEDPRSGISTLTVLSVSREEPDPAFFRPPANYTGRINSTVPVGATDATDPSSPFTPKLQPGAK